MRLLGGGLLVLLAACEPDVSMFMPDGWRALAIVPGNGGSGGAGGSGGSEDGGEGGCMPSRAACGDQECAYAPDGCGDTISCGTCDNESTCVDGMCCQMAPCAEGKCGTQDDGCGSRRECRCAEGMECDSDSVCCRPRTECGPGMCGLQPGTCDNAVCDDRCGDNLWMSCGASARCECLYIGDRQDAIEERYECNRLGGRRPFVCGEEFDGNGQRYEDIPEGCVAMSFSASSPPARLWCCP